MPVSIGCLSGSSGALGVSGACLGCLSWVPVSGASRGHSLIPPPLFPSDTGLQISASDYNSGRLLMIYKPQPQSLWVFLQPFEKGVWLLMFGATVVVALVLALLEYPWGDVLRGNGATEEIPKAGVLDYWKR